MLVLSNETGCSHFPSCAFKSECENRTLILLQRFVGLVLLELSELSSHAFSQSGNNFSRAVPFYISLLVYISLLIIPCIIYVTNKETLNLDDDAFVRFEDKGQIFQPIAQAWHRNLRSDSVLVHTGYVAVPYLYRVSVPNPNQYGTFNCKFKTRNHDVIYSYQCQLHCFAAIHKFSFVVSWNCKVSVGCALQNLTGSCWLSRYFFPTVKSDCSLHIAE